MGDNYVVRQMVRSDIDAVHALTEEERWDMDKSYLEFIYNTDPTGLIVVTTESGQIVGHIASLKHGEDVAAFGLNIIQKDHRGKGVGKKMFQRMLDINKGRNICCISLLNRLSFYEQFGLTISSFIVHYNKGPVYSSFIRDVPKGEFAILSLNDVNFEEVVNYDATLNTVKREKYLDLWTRKGKAAICYVARNKNGIVGYGVLQTSGTNHKMFPLYADTGDVAKALFCTLAKHIPNGENVIYVNPADNENSKQIVAANELKLQLQMRRLYSGREIPVNINRVYSLSSTEFGIV